MASSINCKVLSKNHALIWYYNGSFYLQDTKSRNGTYVNNKRLSNYDKLYSVPTEVKSGDIVQFGIIMANKSGCKVKLDPIVAKLKLYTEDEELCRDSSTLSLNNIKSVRMEDLYNRNEYIQEILLQEHLLQSKLEILQQLVPSLPLDFSWKSFSSKKELTRVETLGKQIHTYTENFSGDKFEEVSQMFQTDKCVHIEVSQYSYSPTINKQSSSMKEQNCSIFPFVCQNNNGDGNQESTNNFMGKFFNVKKQTKEIISLIKTQVHLLQNKEMSNMEEINCLEMELEFHVDKLFQNVEKNLKLQRSVQSLKKILMKEYKNKVNNTLNHTVTINDSVTLVNVPQSLDLKYLQNGMAEIKEALEESQRKTKALELAIDLLAVHLSYAKKMFNETSGRSILQKKSSIER